MIRPSGSRIDDGRDLVRQCLDTITDLCDFPPKVMILLATVSFQPFEKLLEGIQFELKSRVLDVPLVGCSVAGVITEQEVMLEGCALICIASRLIEAKVGLAKNAMDDTDTAIDSLLSQLGLLETQEDLNPQGNRFLLCFLPGFTEGGKYDAVKVHKAIRAAVQSRIPMVGGVAGDNFQRKGGWEFINNQVETNGAVVALIESDMRFGIGMAHGLQPTGEYLHIEEIADNGHRILYFEKTSGRGEEAKLEKKTPKEIIDEYSAKGRTIFFGGIGSEEDDRIILFPRIREDGSADIALPVHEHWPIELLEAQPNKLQEASGQAMARAVQKGHIDVFHLSCIIGFSCEARFELASKIGLDVNVVLKEMRKNYPSVPIMGGLVYGEIGLGELGRSVLRGWTVSELLFADQPSQRGIQRRGYVALANAGYQIAKSESVKYVLSKTMSSVTTAGFPGGMISLIFRDKGSYVIVAKESAGLGWKKIELITKRKAGESDILAVLAESRQAEFIPDSRIDKRCEPEAVKICGVISQYVVPLIGIEQSVMGVLQIDLGDMSNLRDLPGYLKTLFKAFAGPIATAICRSLRLEELALSDLFDKAITASLACQTIKKAVQEFVNVLANRNDLIGTDIIHVRLVATSDRSQLELVAGIGAYYHAALRERPLIPVPSKPGKFDSPSVKAFVSGRSRWVNDVENDQESKEFVQSLPQEQARKVLTEEHSYVNMLIRGREDDLPIGVIIIASKNSFFFSESMWRSMQTLGQRLFFAIKNAEETEAKEKRSREVKFLLDMTPRLSTELDLRKSLRTNAERIARAASAEVVSFFLWDAKKGALVLQGQYGWKEDMIGRAVYKLKEGMTGYSARLDDPQYIDDLARWKRNKRQREEGRYEKEMFRKKLEHAKYEVITIPLRFGKLLGVLTMQNMLLPNDPATKFITKDDNLLKEVADDLSAFVYASQAYEKRMQTLIEHKRSENQIVYIATILAQVTHDLRNKLESIRADVSTLAEDVQSEEERKLVYRIKNVCEELASRMERYLNVVDREEPLKWTLVGLNRVLNNAMKRCMEKARHQKVRLDFVPGPEVYVSGAEIELEDAFFNIMDNGIKAMDEGGTLSVTLETFAAGKRVRIRITDEGKGIPDEEIPQIIDGFYKSTAEKRPAMGVFLSKSIFERHGGTLKIKSKIRKGTTVLTTLPCSDMVPD